jgi:cyclic beta-1,2-glucan synthetase
MPTLVLDEPHGSVLAAPAARRCRSRWPTPGPGQVPWGISESAYAASDHTWPTSTRHRACRAWPCAAPRPTSWWWRPTPPPWRRRLPRAAQPELRWRWSPGRARALRLHRGAGLSRPARQARPQPFARVVRTYMAHHQGMTIVALANVLHGGIGQRWGMANAHRGRGTRCCTSARRARCRCSRRRLAGRHRSALQPRAPRAAARRGARVHAVEPTHLLSNGTTA